MTIHDLDLCRWLADTEFTGVFVRAATLVDAAFADAGDVDTAVVTLWAEDGFCATIQNSRRSNCGFDQRIEIMGSQATVALANVPLTQARFIGPDGERGDVLPDHFPQRYREAYEAQLEHFADALEAGEPPGTSVLDGVAALQLADACARSLATGVPVAIQPFARDVPRTFRQIKEATRG
jgi:myo-inositol 2-dehydrogenase/D-chiro-inositol 1-dehydrogenase